MLDSEPHGVSGREPHGGASRCPAPAATADRGPNVRGHRNAPGLEGAGGRGRGLHPSDEAGRPSTTVPEALNWFAVGETVFTPSVTKTRAP